MALQEKLKQLQEKIKRSPLISFTFLIFVLLLLILIPFFQMNYYGVYNATKEVTLENPYISILYKIMGVIGIAGFFSLVTLHYSRKQTSAMERSNNIALKGQATSLFEHYSRAIEQLGNDKLEIRLGAISTLEIIANKSDEFYWQIMELLTAYIRENSTIKKDVDIDSIEYFNQPPEETKVREDIQAILTVIGERRYSYKADEDKRLNLEGTNLRKANLDDANLNGVNFTKANLEGASLRNAKLKEAVFKGANLRNTSLVKAHLENAEMLGAYLELAQLNHAHLEGAVLGGVRLNSANMREAHLEGAVLIAANLSYVRLEEADFLGTNLLEANFTGAYIKEAKNIVPKQLYDVKTLYNAELDTKLEEELRLKGYSHLLDNEP